MKNSILIVDDQEINRVLLAELFKDEYNIIEAENGQEALDIINEDDSIIAVMLDLIMPVMDGMSVLSELNRTGKIYNIPVFIITAADNMQMLTGAYNLGAVDIISKPFRMCFIKARISNIVELYRHRNELVDIVDESVEKMSKINDKMVETLATLIEFRDCESGEHVKRIKNITIKLMTKVSEMFREYRLDKSTIAKIGTASILHDVGKIAIPDNILKKPGRLTPEEFEIMKIHTVKGCDILAQMPEDIMDHEVYRFSYDICRHHHERWDGRGYPDGLKGDEVSIWAQVAAVADVFDALTSPRVYKASFNVETAVKMINNGECGQFNPKVLEAFNSIVDDLVKKHSEEEE
ncbi:MAG: response regulator [Ruminococcaceae bacterium]|nr:response regulator [Oscillospiraceae bacterium]